MKSHANRTPFKKIKNSFLKIKPRLIHELYSFREEKITTEIESLKNELRKIEEMEEDIKKEGFTEEYKKRIEEELKKIESKKIKEKLLEKIEKKEKIQKKLVEKYYESFAGLISVGKNKEEALIETDKMKVGEERTKVMKSWIEKNFSKQKI